MKSQGKLIVINYSDNNFRKVQKLCSRSAKIIGKADEVIEYSPDDLSEEFKLHNKMHFTHKRGAGLWVWKPYIIDKTLSQMKDSDFLLYSDAGVVFYKPIDKLVKGLERSNSDIMVFELPLIEKEWTKNETQKIILEEEKNFSNDNQILASYVLIKNTSSSRSFVKEWLNYAQNYQAICPETISNIPNDDNYIAHREDQSILSLLCRKYGIKPFKDPSQYGERPEGYKWNPDWKCKPCKFNPKVYDNSDYNKILISVRTHDPFEIVFREILEDVNHYIPLLSFYRKIKNLIKKNNERGDI